MYKFILALFVKILAFVDRKVFLILPSSVSLLLLHVDPLKHASCKTIIDGIT